MSFREAVAATPQLGEGSYRRGLQAVDPAYRARVQCENTRRLCGSVDIDGRLQPIFRGAQRWDYAICYRESTQRVYWVEVHPASQRGIAEVDGKFEWLQEWLAGDGRRLRSFTPRYIWISSGETTFTKASPQIRRLALKGVQTVGRILKIP